ncbi:carboxypeptidase B-like [Belonocnema kinseyi]|uniref:carboxypeptidase B-like n=1 Tax=Belonocnema kinseyi TaxID=2817044 RepID=UPI00143E035F|nr:carboxypeptidase B-like [Belonocnema kinseyi]
MGPNFLIIAILVAFVFANEESFRSLKGAQEISITCETEKQLDFVLRFEDNNHFDFLKVSHVPPENVQVLVTENQLLNFKMQLDQNGIKYKVLVDDFQKVIDEESKAQRRALMLANRSHQGDENDTYDFDHFPRHNAINDYMEQMTKKYEDVTLFSIGYSYDGRSINGVKISSGGNKTKPAILIDGGIHAREWISPVTALHTISELVNEKNKELYKNVDWYIIPVLNPDGYEFTHGKDRLWRKNRSKIGHRQCRGVDLNRNFGYKWKLSGRSRHPCHITYAGKAPFSELESQHLRDFFLSKNGTIKIYLTLHSFGKYLLYPWGYTPAEVPENEDVLLKLGVIAAVKLKALYGTEYKIGSAARILYPAAGGSDDWAKAIGKADIAFTIELPGTSFVIDPSLIKPIGLETFEAFRVFGVYAEIVYKDL